jgi:hypothetical protein
VFLKQKMRDLAHENGAVATTKKYGKSREEQKRAFEELGNTQLRLGDKWFLINSDWYTKWLNYLGVAYEDSLQYKSTAESEQVVPAPDKINNKSLLTFNAVTKRFSLKETIVEELDYYTVPEELWLYLSELYETTRKEVGLLSSFFYVFKFGFSSDKFPWFK